MAGRMTMHHPSHVVRLSCIIPLHHPPWAHAYAPHFIRRFRQVWQYPLVGGRPIWLREFADLLGRPQARSCQREEAEKRTSRCYPLGASKSRNCSWLLVDSQIGAPEGQKCGVWILLVRCRSTLNARCRKARPAQTRVNRLRLETMRLGIEKR